MVCPKVHQESDAEGCRVWDVDTVNARTFGTRFPDLVEESGTVQLGDG